MFSLICFIVFLTVTTANPTFTIEETPSTGNDSDVSASVNKEFHIQYYAKANWYNAYLFCRNSGMNLATINSEEEQIYLQQVIEDNGFTNEKFWISGSDLGDENRFSWYSVGKLLKYTNWNSGEPNNKGEHCIEIKYKDQLAKWNDSKCTTIQPFICEIEFSV